VEGTRAQLKQATKGPCDFHRTAFFVLMALGYYSQRDKILSKMGYSTYAAYLESSLWSNIRNGVMSACGRRCCACKKKANQVHHSEYTEANLSGDSTAGLHPICHKCHSIIEFDDTGQKLFDMVVVNARLDALIANPIIVPVAQKPVIPASKKKRRRNPRKKHQPKPKRTNGFQEIFSVLHQFRQAYAQDEEGLKSVAKAHFNKGMAGWRKKKARKKKRRS
jgi:hypothetical protein